MEKRSELQKAVLISMAAMVVLFGVLMVAARFQKGVEFEGGLLRRTETEESVIYNGKVRGEQVEITVRAAGSGNLTEVDFRIGNRIQDDCTLETGLPPIQAEQLGPVEHIRITKNDILLFEGGYDPEYGMGWYDLDGNWDPFAMSVSYSSTAGDDYWEHYETDRGTILSFARGPQLVSRGSWDAVFHHAAVFRPAGAGRRIPIGPVPLAAYVRREGPGAVGLLSGNAAGGLVHLSDLAAHRVQHRPVGAAVAD